MRVGILFPSLALLAAIVTGAGLLYLALEEERQRVTEPTVETACPAALPYRCLDDSCAAQAEDCTAAEPTSSL